MQDIKKMFIDGVWVSSVSGQRRGIVNPANGQIIALVTEGCLEDTEMAVRSAYRAFYEDNEWRNTTGQERSKILLEVADKLEERSIEFALLETMDNGKSLRESKIDVADAVSCFRYYAGLANKPHGHVVEVPDPVHSTVVREPIGVCALITPWNYPLLMSV